MAKILTKALFAFLLVIAIAASVSAIENATIEEQARICINESTLIFKNLLEENFSVIRVNDSLKGAKNWLNAQVILKEKNKSYDFSLVLPYCNEIKDIKKEAFKARDSLNALKEFYSEILTKDMNTSNVDKSILKIEEEIRNERYEKTAELIEKTYAEIINIKSSQTTLNIFYKATTRSLKRFFQETWIYFVSVVIILGVLFMIYKKSVVKWYAKMKINKLELRKATLKEMIMKTQRDYFQHGNISETVYNIRTKKFAELIRDIDRQIPLLKEELVKASRK